LALLPAVFVVGVVVRSLVYIMGRRLPHGLGTKTSPDFVLESLPVSPFVEKVRFVLDNIDGLSYREECDYGVVMMFRASSVPALHWVRAGSWAVSTISSSRDAAEYLAGRYPAAQFLQRPASMSAEEVQAFETLTDEACEAMRRLFYHHVLVATPQDCVRVLWGSNDARVPAWQRAIGPLILPMQKAMLIKAFRLTAPNCRSKCAARLLELFDLFWARIDKAKNKTVADTEQPHKLDFYVACAVAMATESREYSVSCPDSFGEAVTKQMTELAADLAPLKRHPIAAWAEAIYKKHRRHGRNDVNSKPKAQ
jgi:hypothetical protein